MLTPNFTANQTALLPTTLSVTDASTGSDAAITQRRIYLIKADETYLVPSGTTTDFIQWAYAQSIKTIANVLSEDVALNIQVDWLDVDDEVLYTKTILYDLPNFGELFDLGLCKQMASTPNIINSTDFFLNKMKFRVCLDSAAQAVSLGDDIYSAQGALDIETYLQSNTQFFY
jgi:hypothetical protein